MADHLDLVAYFARYSATVMEMTCSPTIHGQTKWERWNVIKGPFVHAKTKEIFEQKTYERILQIYNAHPDAVDSLVDYVNKKLPPGIDFSIDKYTWHPLSFGKQLLKQNNQNIDLHPSMQPKQLLTFDQMVRNRADEIIKKLSN
jgi:ribosomal protein S10